MSWGPAYWRFLHYFALNDKDMDLFQQLPRFIPCEMCINEWEDPVISTELVMWSKELHNKVNRKLGKWDRWDMTDFGIAHKNTCDYCDDREFVHMFPWLFIHVVAETGGADALAFLKRFNEIYPCEVCRGKFFTDDPADGETVLDWTIRHHKRMNEERGRPAYVHPIEAQSNETGSGCVGCSSSNGPVVY